MTGTRPGFYWRATWKVVSPLLLLTIFVAYVALLASSPPAYKAWNPQYVSPLSGGTTQGPRTQPDTAPQCPPLPEVSHSGHRRPRQPKDHAVPRMVLGSSLLHKVSQGSRFLPC